MQCGGRPAVEQCLAGRERLGFDQLPEEHLQRAAEVVAADGDFCAARGPALTPARTEVTRGLPGG